MPSDQIKTTQNQPHQDKSPSEELYDGAVITGGLPDRADIAIQNLLKDIPYHLLEPILAGCSVRHLREREVLISPGQENHYVYLLLSGHLQVYLDTDESQISFPIGTGECVGEMSIIEGRLTSAHVIAEEASRLIAMPEEVFWDELMRLPGAVRNMLGVMAQRMRKVNEVVLRTQEQRLRYEQLQQELEAAGKIQANILPKDIPLFPDHPQVEVCATLEPAREVGGDFYDAIALDSRHIYIAIGDVCGKGLPAALFMVRAMALLRTTLSNPDVFESVLPAVNQMMCQNNPDSTFVSLFVGLFDVKSGRLTYMNGGHNPPFFARRGDTFKLLTMPKGTVLGVYEEARYEVAELIFKPGDSLVLYTDGITEAENSRQEFFSTERAAEVLNRVVDADDLTVLLNTLEKSVLRFSRGQPQADDLTILALRYKGEAGGVE